jgi:hypothetical protein
MSQETIQPSAEQSTNERAKSSISVSATPMSEDYSPDIPESSIKDIIRHLYNATCVSQLSIWTFVIILIFGITLYTYYGVISFAMFNSDIVVSSNLTASDYVIVPCVVDSIEGVFCPDEYNLVNTSLICDQMFDRIGNQIYSDYICVFDNDFCTSYSTCECLDHKGDKDHAGNTSVTSDTNYTLIFIVVIVAIFSITLTAIIIYLISLCIVIKNIGTMEDDEIFGTACEPNGDSCANKSIFTLNWSFIYLFAVLVILSSILLPVFVFNGAKGNTCDYVCNTCYYIDFTLNPIVEVECAVDNSICYKNHWLGGSDGVVDEDYNNLHYFNANNTWNPYAVGVLLITFTVVATIIFNVLLILLCLLGTCIHTNWVFDVDW